MDLAYAPELVQGKVSTCVPTMAGDEEALTCVLEGTGLQWKQLRQGVFVIQEQQKDATGSGSEKRSQLGDLHGTVRSQTSGDGLTGVHVQLVGTAYATASGLDGDFSLKGIPAGHYTLEVSMIGYKRIRVEGVKVNGGVLAEQEVLLAEDTYYLDEVVVSDDDRSTPFLSMDSGAGVLNYQGMQLGPVAMGVLISARPHPVNGVQFGGLGSLVRDSLRGVQVAGLFNSAEMASTGIQVSGLANRVNASLDGVQVAGLVNTMTGDLDGVQVGGLANNASRNVTGVQVGGLVNRVGNAFSGVQVGGLINMNTQHTRGVQAAGLLNRSTSAGGIQVAGLVNIAQGPVGGMQLAVVNMAHSMRGVQLGVVNISGSNSGVPFGLVSYVKDVGLRYDVSVDETGMLTTAVRSGTRGFSNYLGFSARPDDVQRTPSLVLGFGSNVVLRPRLTSMVDLLYNGVGFEEDTDHLMKLRLSLGYRVLPFAEVFGGPTLNLLIADEANHGVAIPWRFERGQWGSHHYEFWAGFTGGVRVSTRR